MSTGETKDAGGKLKDAFEAHGGRFGDAEFFENGVTVCEAGKSQALSEWPNDDTEDGVELVIIWPPEGEAVFDLRQWSRHQLRQYGWGWGGVD